MLNHLEFCDLQWFEAKSSPFLQPTHSSVSQRWCSSSWMKIARNSSVVVNSNSISITDKRSRRSSYKVPKLCVIESAWISHLVVPLAELHKRKALQRIASQLQQKLHSRDEIDDTHNDDGQHRVAYVNLKQVFCFIFIYVTVTTMTVAQVCVCVCLWPFMCLQKT